MSIVRGQMAHDPLGEPSTPKGVLPAAFCWTRYGAEAGEPAAGILARKELERVLSGGTFLWGIGTSIRPSLHALVAEVEEPEVLFSPMLSRPAPQDAAPDAVVAWRSATGVDGEAFEMPPGSLVTSRLSGRRQHYALVCHRPTPLPVDGQSVDGWVDDRAIRNILTGRPVGSSQVTSVVRPTGGHRDSRYRVAFRARLLPPFLAVLGDPEIL